MKKGIYLYKCFCSCMRGSGGSEGSELSAFLVLCSLEIAATGLLGAASALDIAAAGLLGAASALEIAAAGLLSAASALEIAAARPARCLPSAEIDATGLLGAACALEVEIEDARHCYTLLCNA